MEHYRHSWDGLRTLQGISPLDYNQRLDKIQRATTWGLWKANNRQFKERNQNLKINSYGMVNFLLLTYLFYPFFYLLALNWWLTKLGNSLGTEAKILREIYLLTRALEKRAPVALRVLGGSPFSPVPSVPIPSPCPRPAPVTELHWCECIWNPQLKHISLDIGTEKRAFVM